MSTCNYVQKKWNDLLCQNVSKGIFIQLKYPYSVKDAQSAVYIFSIFVMEWPVCKVLNPITVCFNPAGGPRPLNMKI